MKGVPTEKLKDDVYAIEVPVGATKIIFNNKGQEAQTADLAIKGKWNIFIDGNWSAYSG
ncbi:MAG: hypothetical protein IKB73_05105 [Ruminococcus sp.]|nr:hypothetical protein [Ruminococcus sp.]